MSEQDSSLPQPPADLPANPSVSYRPDRSGLSTEWVHPLETAGEDAHRTDGSFRGPTPETLAPGRRPESLEDIPLAPREATFRLLRKIGRGGFGEVWEAVQESLDRVIAVKRPREDMYARTGGDSASVRAQESAFRTEAVTTGALDHPNIVPIYDLGSDAEGRPLLAMKRIHGVPWDEAIRRDWNLPPAEYYARHLPVLIAATQAVAFAHARGIVHRDIKPSQIMVGEFGEVFLMDWGLAIAVDDREPVAAGGLRFASAATRESATSPGGTVAFMAPEQTENTARNVGTWTDVYLLGGTLYYLLTGTCPHDPHDARAAFFEAVRGVVRAPQAAAPQRDMPRELAALAMRAMEPNPERRVPSAQAFLEALKDWLTGASRRREAQALLAEATAKLEGAAGRYGVFAECDRTLLRAQALDASPEAEALRQRLHESYARTAMRNGDLTLARDQAGRLADDSRRVELEREIDRAAMLQRRHARQRRLLFAATAVLLALSSFLAWRADNRAKEAERARSQAEKLANVMLVDLHGRLRSLGRLELLDKVSDKVLEYYREAPATATTLEASMRRAEAARNVSEVYWYQGRMEEALSALRDALGSLEAAALHAPEDGEVLLMRANLHRLRGDLELSRGDATAAEGAYAIAAQAMERRERALRPGASARHDREFVELHLSLSRWKESRGDLAEARRFAELALDRARIGRERSSTEGTGAVETLAGAMQRVADLARREGDLDEAEENYRAAVELLADAKATGEDIWDLRAQHAAALDRLGSFYERQGRLEEAAAAYADGTELLRTLVEKDPTNRQWLRSLSVLLSKTGDAAMNVKDDDGARAAYAECLSILRQLAARDPLNARARRDLSIALDRAGYMHEASGDWAQALALYEESHALRRALLEADPANASAQMDLAVAALQIADTLRKSGAPAKSLERYREARASLAVLLDGAPDNADYLAAWSSAAVSEAKVLRAGADTKGEGDALLRQVLQRTKAATREPVRAALMLVAARAEALWLLEPGTDEARELLRITMDRGWNEPAFERYAREAALD